MAQVYQTVGGAVTSDQNAQFQGRLVASGAIQVSGEISSPMPVGIATYSLNKSSGSLYFRMQPIRQKAPSIKSIETEATVIADVAEDGSVTALEVLLIDKEIVDGINVNIS